MAIENRIVIGLPAEERINESNVISTTDVYNSNTTISITSYQSISVSNHRIVGSSSLSTSVTWTSAKGTVVGSAHNGRYLRISNTKYMKIDHIEMDVVEEGRIRAICSDGSDFYMYGGATVYLSTDPNGSSPTTFTIDPSNLSAAVNTIQGKYISRTGTSGTYSYASNVYAYVSLYYVKVYGYLENYSAAKSYDFAFENNNIESITGEFAVGTVGDELTTDTLTVNVRSTREITSKYGDIVQYYQDGTLFSKMYIESVKRLSEDRYTLNCVSAIGLLDNIYSEGFLYTGSGLGYAIINILSGVLTLDTDYTISPDVFRTMVYGWLPYDIARNNLHKLLLAYNVSMVKSPTDAGKILFCFLGQDGVQEISQNNTYIEGSYITDKKPTKIVVREHSFIGGNTEPVVLFDNSSDGVRADYQLVVFDNAPIERLEVPGTLTVNSFGVNHAYVSGIGVLLGYPYFHNTFDLTLNTGAQESESTVSITDDTMISIQNSQPVMDRLESYYLNAKKSKISLALNGEKCGYRYNFSTPMRQRIEKALLSKMSINVSTFTKADCEMISDINLVGGGDVLSRALVVNFNYTLTIPSWWAANTPIRVVLIGGGTGGDSGYAGANGEDGNSVSGGNGGKGGAGGNGGSSGRVYEFSLKVNPSQTFQIQIGAGGNGGSASSSHNTNNSGSEGGNTTFGNYSSASGNRIDNGFIEFQSRNKYATVGGSGTTGGNGGKGGDLFQLNDTSDYGVADGESGESCGSRNGGVGASNQSASYSVTEWNGSSSTSHTYRYASGDTGGYRLSAGNCGGGGGSGAVATSNGIAGGAASGSEQNTSGTSEVSQWVGTLYAGKGANGVQPSARTASTTYGAGGDGGHGGSGAGGNGAIRGYKDNYYISNPWYTGNFGNTLDVGSSSHTVGTGGNGGAGGKGGDGCVIIYAPYSLTTSNSAVASIAIVGKAIVGKR